MSLIEPGPKGVPGDALLGQFRMPLASGGQVTPTNFLPNPRFIGALHDCVARHGPDSTGISAEARRIVDGSILVIDGRTPTPMGSVTPEDIIGAFEVRDGRVVRENYEANPHYQVLTSNGFTRLDDQLMHAFRTQLRSLVQDPPLLASRRGSRSKLPPYPTSVNRRIRRSPRTPHIPRRLRRPTGCRD